MENMYAAYQDAARKRRYRRDVLRFGYDAWDNVAALRESVLDGSYGIDRYHEFYVYEPKKRMVMSIAFPHRVVQWAVYRIINPMLVKGYITDTYGCIKGRGSLKAVERVRGWMDQAARRPGKWYYLKMDISKYFYRIPHDRLKEAVRHKIADRRLVAFLDGVIDCPHTAFGLPEGKSPGEVPPSERLFDVGMPIGNLLSQMFANLYLDALDQFCKRELRMGKACRFIDDIFAISDSKAELAEDRDRIGEFLEGRLGLRLNAKTCIRPIGQGVEFVGNRIWPGRTEIRKSTALRMKRGLRAVRRQYRDYGITFHRANDTFRSYLGMLGHTTGKTLRKKVIDSMVLTHGGKCDLFRCSRGSHGCPMGFGECGQQCRLFGKCSECEARHIPPGQLPCKDCARLEEATRALMRRGAGQ